MKKTTTIENLSAARLRALQRLEELTHTRHIIHCGKCGSGDEFNEGDSMDAAAWFEMIGWQVRAGQAKCPNCTKR